MNILNQLKRGLALFLLAATLPVSVAYSQARFANLENFGGQFYGTASVAVALPGYGQVLIVSPGHDQTLRAYSKINTNMASNFVDVTTSLFPQPVGFGITDISAPDLNGDGYYDLLFRFQSIAISTSFTPVLPPAAIGYALLDPVTESYLPMQTLYAPINYTIPSNPVVVDYNFDGRQDILFADVGITTFADLEIAVFIQQPNGTFAVTPVISNVYPQIYDIVLSPQLVTGDINGDGVDDVFVAYQRPNNNPCNEAVIEGLLSDPSSSSYTQTQVAIVNGAYPDGLTFNSLGVGLPSELIVGYAFDTWCGLGQSTLPSNTARLDGFRFNSGVIVQRTLLSGIPHFDQVAGFHRLSQTKIKTADIDSDGLSEIFIANFYNGLRIFSPISSAGSFVDITGTLIPSSTNLRAERALLGNYSYDFQSHPFEVFDFSGDGLQDLILPMTGAYGTYLRGTALGFRNETFSAGVEKKGSLDDSFNVALCSSDFNGDSFQDIVRVDVSDNVYFHFGDGTGNFPISKIVTVPNPVGATSNYFKSCVVVDYDMDGDNDMILSGVSILALRNMGASNFGYVRLNLQGQGMNPALQKSVAVTDLFMDGVPDIVLTDSESIRVYRNTLSGFLHVGGYRYSQPLSVWDSKVTDLNLDGFPEVAVLVENTINWPYLEVLSGQATSNGRIRFSRTSVAPNVTSIEISDIDGDGIPEVGYAEIGNIGFFSMQPGFIPPPMTALFNTAMHLKFADFDGDGDQDVIAAHQTIPSLLDTHNLALIENTSTALSTLTFINARPQRVMDINVKDFDSDGDLDMLVSSNDKYDTFASRQITQAKLYSNLNRHFSAIPRAFIDAQGNSRLDFSFNSSEPGTLAILFGSLSPLTSGPQTQFGLLRLASPASVLSLPISSSTSSTEYLTTLSGLAGANGQKLNLQALFIPPVGPATFSAAQSIEFVN
jgi:hypothetical protein